MAAEHVAEVIATILANPAAHIGKVYELTGPKSQDMHGVAAEYSAALTGPITYVDVPLEQWRDQELRNRNLPEHVLHHLLTMAHLHAANRYDRSPTTLRRSPEGPRRVCAILLRNDRKCSDDRCRSLARHHAMTY